MRVLPKARKAQSKPALTQEKFLSEQEYLQLLAHLNSLKLVNFRNVTLILTALFTGARANEVLNIRAQDLLPDQSIHIRGLKNSNDRNVPIPEWLVQDLNKIASTTTGSDDYVFQISYRRFKQIWDGYKLTHHKLHATRHTFAVRLYKRTRDLFLVKAALGHVDLENTLVYLKFVHSQDEMSKILETA